MCCMYVCVLCVFVCYALMLRVLVLHFAKYDAEVKTRAKWLHGTEEKTRTKYGDEEKTRRNKNSKRKKRMLREEKKKGTQ
jgi:hypothetical protein